MTELAEVIAGIEDFSIEGQEKVVMELDCGKKVIIQVIS